jgi:hypothetical protein
MFSVWLPPIDNRQSRDSRGRPHAVVLLDVRPNRSREVLRELVGLAWRDGQRRRGCTHARRWTFV